MNKNHKDSKDNSSKSSKKVIEEEKKTVDELSKKEFTKESAKSTEEKYKEEEKKAEKMKEKKEEDKIVDKGSSMETIKSYDITEKDFSALCDSGTEADKIIHMEKKVNTKAKKKGTRRKKHHF